MGFIKLALIGGAAYWAGKKFSERHDGMNQHGYNGSCSRRRRNQQEQQDQMYSARDMGPYQYQDYPEKSTQQYQPEYQNMNGYTPQYGGHDRNYAHAPRSQDEKQMTKYDDAERMTLPAYASNTRLSPQQRMYPGGGMDFPESKRPYAAEQSSWK